MKPKKKKIGTAHGTHSATDSKYQNKLSAKLTIHDTFYLSPFKLTPSKTTCCGVVSTNKYFMWAWKRPGNKRAQSKLKWPSVVWGREEPTCARRFRPAIEQRKLKLNRTQTPYFENQETRTGSLPYSCHLSKPEVDYWVPWSLSIKVTRAFG